MTDVYGIDSHKLHYHPERVASLRAGLHDWEAAKKVYPLYVELSPNGACNHRCIFCAKDYIGYKPVSLDIGVMRERLPEMARLGVKSVMLAGEGEPLLYKHINEMVRIAKSGGLDVAFTTNASVLPDGFVEEALPQVSWLKASVNAGTRETYARVHRVKASFFDRVVANLSAMARARRERGLGVTLGAQILLLPENANEIHRLAAICRDEIGLDYLVVKPFSAHKLSTQRDYDELRYDEYLSLGRDLEAFNTSRFHVVFRAAAMKRLDDAERYPRCRSVPFLWAYVMADGTVSGCSAYLLDPRFEFGNLHEQTFQSIWESEKRKANWQFVRDDLNIEECRLNCRMEPVNRYLYRLIDNPPEHVNFI